MHRPASANWHVGLFLTCLVARLWVIGQLWAFSFDPAQSSDSLFYFRWALRILEGNWSEGAFYGLPGYPAALALVFSIVGLHPIFVTLIQAVSESLIAILIFDIANRVSANRESIFAGAIASIGWILFEPAQAFSAVLMPTSFAVLIFWGVVYAALRDADENGPKPFFWFAAGLVAGLASTMVGTLLLLTPWLLARILCQQGWRTRILGIACLAVGLGAGTSPCWIHNRFIAKEPVTFSAHSGVNFYLGNNALANGYPRVPPELRASQQGMLQDSISVAEKEAGHPLKKFEVSRHWSTKAHQFIEEHPLLWLKLLLRKLWNFWRAWEYDDLSLLPLLRLQGAIIPGIGFGVVAAFALPGMVIAIRRNRQSIWVAGAVVAHLLALLPVFITERYRLAAVPGLLVFAGFCVEYLWNSVTFRQTVPAVTTAGTVLLLSVILAIPPEDPRLIAVTPYNLGVQLLNLGDPKRALPFLETAWRYGPDNGEINFALGNSWFSSDNIKAEAFYRRTLNLIPDHPGAWKNLGAIALEQKRWQEAYDRLQRASKLNNTAQTQYLLAVACHGLMNYTEAVHHMESSIRMNPNVPAYAAYLAQLRSLQ